MSSDSEVVYSRPAARSAGFAEPAFVLLTESSGRAKHQPVWAAGLDLRAAAVPGPGVKAGDVSPQELLSLDLTITRLLPGGRVAAHVVQVLLLHR